MLQVTSLGTGKSHKQSEAQFLNNGILIISTPLIEASLI